MNKKFSAERGPHRKIVGVFWSHRKVERKFLHSVRPQINPQGTRRQLPSAHRPPVHDDIIVQRVADGYIAVIGHGCKVEKLSSSKLNYQQDL